MIQTGTVLGLKRDESVYANIHLKSRFNGHYITFSKEHVL